MEEAAPAAAHPQAPVDVASLSTPLCSLESRKQFLQATRKEGPVMLMYFKKVDGEVQIADGDAPEDFHALDLHAAEPSSLEDELIARVPADVLKDNPHSAPPARAVPETFAAAL
eukprot:2925991-Rhodomonas_salina.1